MTQPQPKPTGPLLPAARPGRAPAPAPGARDAAAAGRDAAPAPEKPAGPMVYTQRSGANVWPWGSK